MGVFFTGIGIQFTEGMITSTIGYIGDVFSDLSSLILLIVGVGLGLMVVGTIVSIIKR
jgi:hypothetical protein